VVLVYEVVVMKELFACCGKATSRMADMGVRNSRVDG
jgi:hypothetical protein